MLWRIKRDDGRKASSHKIHFAKILKTVPIKDAKLCDNGSFSELDQFSVQFEKLEVVVYAKMRKCV